MQTSMAATALLMGLAGGPHCIAMCGAACAGIGKAAGERGSQAIWTFQLGLSAGGAGGGLDAGVGLAHDTDGHDATGLDTVPCGRDDSWSGPFSTGTTAGVAGGCRPARLVAHPRAACDLGPRGTAGHWRDVGIHALRTVVFSLAGRGAQWQRLGRGVGHGIVCAGEQRFSFGRPLGVAAVRQPGQWRLGRAPGGPGTCGHVRMGALDGPGA